MGGRVEHRWWWREPPAAGRGASPRRGTTHVGPLVCGTREGARRVLGDADPHSPDSVELGDELVAGMGVHRPAGRAGEDHVAGLEADTLLVELLRQPADGPERAAEN